MNNGLKQRVREYWNNHPCGTLIPDVLKKGREFEYFLSVANSRQRLEPFIEKYANPWEWKNKNILEIGCGVGTDLVMFAKHGAIINAIDLSDRSVELTKVNLSANGYNGDIVKVADAEALPFWDNQFDLVYSWGALQCLPDTKTAISEIRRVLKPNGTALIMLYNRYSLVSLQLYIIFGLLRLNPFAKLNDLFGKYHESPGLKVYTMKETLQMFAEFKDVTITNQLTCYDLRYNKYSYLPSIVGNFIPKGLGFFNIIKATK